MQPSPDYLREAYDSRNVCLESDFCRAKFVYYFAFNLKKELRQAGYLVNAETCPRDPIEATASQAA
jgi:hypothetical protein